MNKKIHSLALLVNLGIYGVAQAQEPTDTPVSHDDTIVVTAAEQNLQAPGVSTITADEIRKNPVARDVSEIIRTMPGVNLTGNSTSGQRGNNRQIDIRGMGPENTLILIDGKPVSSRNSVRQGWRGERDTRGDTSWVPPEMIERIEVLRGPAAARYGNGAAGGTEGKFNEKATQDFVDIDLDDVMLHSEVNLPIDFLVNQTLTLGTEWNQQRMKDLSSNTQALTGTNTGGAIDGVSATDRSPYSKAEIFSLFAENNMELTDSTIVTPGLRFDHHSIVGNNWSPALNISQGLGDDFTLKMGIARAYKAPSLYQTNPNYILYSKGQGCYASAGGCYLQGNDDLKAETSINKEIGLEFKRDGWLAGVTWFRNDYRNKIEAGYVAVGQNAAGTDLYQWDNVPKAVVEGLEGSLNVPVSETVMWTNNITYMLKSENKTTGDRLSIIPEYTLNSTLSWQAREDLSMQTTFTWYGKQQPKKYNYKGQPAVGPETKEISPYSIVGLSATWDVTKNVSLTGGVDNLFDKRLWRAGNAQTTGDLAGANYIAGAGAYTYNEPGRTWYMSVNTHF
ncbi:TPA: FepA family TonB-dependent siderophore receptor [Escherichia coli]|nr:TonB-dependent siderophore receptor [Escherichia coli]